MDTPHRHLVRAAAAAVAALVFAASEPDAGGQQFPREQRQAASPMIDRAHDKLLPKVSDLPADYRPAGDVAGRGVFHTAGGRPAFRLDDGGHYHGYDGPGVWAKEPKGTRTQGVLYGVEAGNVVSAGYLIRQVDLVAGKSFHGMTLRALNFPPAHAMTLDLVAGRTADENQYLFLWHFVPPDPAPPMLPLGQLPLVTSLPGQFKVYACDQYPNRFCPGMGRHYTDLSNPAGRPPTAAGSDGVIYGEAARKLIFIEYVFRQEDLAAGVSWPAMPLNGLPIPPIDNVHVLHFGADGNARGRYTVHMYFLPEQTYLAWEREPDTL